MGSTELLSGADGRLVSLVSTLAASDFDLPSPCAGWSVRSLLSHTISSIDAFAAAVDCGEGPTEAELFSGTDILGTDPLAVVERSVGRSQRAWATISDWHHPVSTVLGTMPAVEAISIITYSTLIHSWDVAVAVGRTVEFDEAEAALAEAVGAALVPALQPQGMFGPQIQLTGEASPTQRVIAFAGRNPL